MFYVFYQVVICCITSYPQTPLLKNRKRLVLLTSLWGNWVVLLVLLDFHMHFWSAVAWVGSPADLGWAPSSVWELAGCTGWARMASERRAECPSMWSFIKPRLVPVAGGESRHEPCCFRPLRGTNVPALLLRSALAKGSHKASPVQDRGKQTPAFGGKSCKAAL